MKVLFVFKEGVTVNKYVSTLKNALISEGVETKCDIGDFWHNFKELHIVHFQIFQGYEIPLQSAEDVDRFVNQFNQVKNKCIIVVTCHDLKPHYSTNTHLDYAVNYVYANCDAMIHLGKYSYNHFINKLDTQVKHYIIPHHIYNNLYHFSLDKSTARKKMKIPQNANVLLCFGLFRHDIERNMILNAWKKVKMKNKYLLAPGFYWLNMRRRNFILLSFQLIKAWYYKLRGVHFKNYIIPDDMMETYLCASDILVIQRAEILNSGNLSLGFHAGKVVVGPNIGNVREILEETGNPVFDPTDITSVTKAIQEGFRLKDTDLPQKNAYYAMENWNVSEIARKHIEVYQDIIKNKTILNESLICLQ